MTDITERELSENLVLSLQSNLDDVVKSAWNAYYSYIRNLDALSKPYDRRLYNLNQKLYEEWKFGK